MSAGPIEIEKDNLEAHVELCAQRYNSLEKRLDGIDEKVEKLQVALMKSHSSMTKILIGTAGTVVAGAISAIVLIIVELHKNS